MRIALFVTEDWYLRSHRLPLVEAAVARGHDVLALTRLSRYGHEIRSIGAEVVHVNLDRSGLNPIRETRAISEIVAALGRFRPDVLHNVALKPIIYGSVAAQVLRLPVVVNAVAGMGSLFLPPNGNYLSAVAHHAVRTAFRAALRGKRSHVIVQNADDRAFVESFGIATEDVSVIAGAGVDLRTFAFHPPPSGEPVQIRYFGRLLQSKGLVELHEASRMLREEGLPVVTELFGDRDPHNPGCIDASLLAAWDREEGFNVRGPTQDVVTEMAASHVVVLPSYREGLPKALAEAAATGRPLVATDVPGCREVVRDGVNGFLVPPRDPVALASALRKLVSDRAARTSMGAKSRAIAEARFGQDTVLNATFDLYSALSRVP